MGAEKRSSGRSSTTATNATQLPTEVTLKDKTRQGSTAGRKSNMTSTAGTADALKDALLDSDTWGGAAAVTNMGATLETMELPQSGPGGRPVDASNTSLEMESSFLMKTGREPTNEEIMEYLEKHQLQTFLTDMIMHVARHFPPDPYEFLLDHIEAMVMKYRAGRTGSTDSKLGSSLSPAPATSAPAAVSPEVKKSIVRHITLVLRHEGMTRTSAEKLCTQFSSAEKKVTEEDFKKMCKHLEHEWGLQQEDSKLMNEVLKRWRFRANAARGTRGMPLWPLQTEDFVAAYASLLRALRDRYVPIGARIHRSLFIKQSAGKLTDSYDMGVRLGRGAYGEVNLVTLKETKEKRVCKVVQKTLQKVPEEDLMAEVEMLRALDHPHIMRVFEFFETEETVEIIMEPVFGGTLTSLVQGLYVDKDGKPIQARPEALTEGFVATVVFQLLSALAYAHDVAGLVHKDLKCDNAMLVAKAKSTTEEILKEPVHVMLADFGIAEVFKAAQPLHPHDAEAPTLATTVSGSFGAGRSSRSTRVGGTPSYMSPEMFKGSFTSKCDIWSLGVMVYQLLTGELPYKADNLLMQAHAVCNPRRHPPWETLARYRWSLGARWFCQQLLTKDEGMRPSASEALKDGWLVKASVVANNIPPSDDEKRALQQQHLQSHLMTMAKACITSQLNLSQLHHLNARFRKYDSSGDGRLSHVEMRQVLEDVGIQTYEDKELIIEGLDTDHSGVIEYSEFIAGCMDAASDDFKQNLRVAFNIFDLDRSGSITLDELKQVLTLGPNETEVAMRPTSSKGLQGSGDFDPGSLLPDGKTVEDVMKEVDKDGSGKVNFAEFEKYLLQELKKSGEAKAKSPAKK